MHNHYSFAGETSAGKSSLLNLFLGKDILPNALQTATTLQYGDRPRFEIAFIGTTITLLADNETDEHMRQRLQDKVNRRDCEHVGIFWPIPWLKVRNLHS